ncbi:MAG: hypothetical protein R3F30_15350 [Planctomycetota bacterium]
MSGRHALLGLLALLPACGALVVPMAEGARYAPCLDHTFEVSGGLQLFSEFDTKLRVDSEVLGLGTTIDLEDDLGFNKTSNVARFDMGLALSESSRLDFSIFNLTRGAEHRLERDIQIGDKLFQINWDVHSAIRTTVYKLAYRWVFWRDRRFDLGLSGGLHWIGLAAKVGSDSFAVYDRAAYELPLPVVGLHARYALLDDLRLSLSSEAFYVEIQGITGYLTDTRLDLDWDIGDNLGLGLGLNGFRTSVDAGDQWLHGKFTYEYGGLLLYLRVFF